MIAIISNIYIYKKDMHIYKYRYYRKIIQKIIKIMVIKYHVH